MESKSIIKSVIGVSGATLTGQVAVFLATPILTRLYSPQAFGELAIFTSIVGILSIICTLQYDRAIHLPSSEERGFSIVIISLLSGLVFSVIFFFLSLWLVANYPQTFPKQHSYLYPLGLFSLSALQIGGFWASRMGHFRLLSLAKLAQAVSMIILQIIGGIFFHTSTVLILGLVLGWLSASLVLLIPSFLRGKVIQFSMLRQSFTRYRNFPLITLPSMLITALGREAPIFFLSITFNDSIVGYYAIANRLATLPAGLFGKAISQTLLHAASQELRSSHKLTKSFDLFATSLIILGTLPFLAMALIAPKIIPTILGETWYTAGYMISILTPLALSFFITSPMTSLFSLLERQLVELKFNFMLSTLRIASMSMVFVFDDIYVCLLLYSLMGSLGYIMGFWGVMHSSHGSLATVQLSLGRELRSGFILLIASHLILFYSHKTVLAVSLICLLFIFTWLIGVRNLYRQYRDFSSQI